MIDRPAHRQLLPSGYFSFPVIVGQNTWLDLLRSAAVLLVLARHGERAISTAADQADGAGGPIHSLFMNGWVGVDLFLVLSGYLIGRSLLRTFGAASTINVQTYFRGRALRIVPAYLFVLFVTAAGLFPFYEVAGEDMLRRIAYHVLFLQDYLPADINVVFWSLGVEEKFYLLAPLLVYALMKTSNPAHAAGILLALFLLSPAIKFMQFMSASSAPDYDAFFAAFRSPFHVSLEPLIAGVAISYVTGKNLLHLSPAAAKWLFGLSAGAMTAWLMSHELLREISLIDATLQPMALALLFGCMVLAAASLPASLATPGSRLWRPVSRLSYALYLVHFPLIPLSLVMGTAFQLGTLQVWLVYLTLAFIAALWLHFAVEKPFLLLKDAQPRNRRDGAARRPAPVKPF